MSSADATVHLEQQGAIATITFDRPSARNAMTWAMYEQLDEALDRIEGNRGVRVAVLRGAGGHFVAGTDIAQFTEFTSGDDGVAYEGRLEDIVAKLEQMRVATIAAVEGFAVGAGLVLAAACDVRIAAPSARFGIPIARTVGNALSMMNYARLVALIGASRTKALLITTDFMTAEEARAIGFVAMLFDSSGFDSHLEALCERISTYSPITIQCTKAAVRRIMSVPHGDDLVRRAYGSADFHEGVAAFVEKRAPKWEGR